MSEKEVVSIRGLNRELYSKMMALSRETGRTVAQLMNEAMDLYLNIRRSFEGSFVRIRDVINQLEAEFKEGMKSAVRLEVADLDFLEIDRKDLDYRRDAKIAFVRVKHLVFKDDIDPQTFRDRIEVIRFCEKVEIPSSIPKMLALEKCRYVGRIVYRGS